MPRRPKADEPSPEVPKGARRVLNVGVLAGLVCAEAMSAMRLYTLGRQAGYPSGLAWLVPAALDIYALTMVSFFSLLPGNHPLRRRASKEAATALVITVMCNALEEIMEAFATHLPYWAPDLLFVMIGALAPFIAFKLIHFFAAVGNSSKTAADTTLATAGADRRPGAEPPSAPRRTGAHPDPAAPQRPPAPGASAAAGPGAGARAAVAPGTSAPMPNAAPAAASPAAAVGAGNAVVYQLDDQRRVNEDEWAQIAEPLYRTFMADNGRGPTANELAAALHAAGHPKFKETRAKEIRRATERRINESPQVAPAGDEKDPEPDRDQDAS